MGKRKAVGIRIKKSKRSCVNPPDNVNAEESDILEAEENDVEIPLPNPTVIRLSSISTNSEIVSNGDIDSPESPRLEATEAIHNENSPANEAFSSLSSEQQCTIPTAFEVIDVDKLPDIPDSPIGDDVIEIISPIEKVESSSSSAPQRSVVDLTDLDDTSLFNENENTEQLQNSASLEMVKPRERRDTESGDEDFPPALFTSHTDEPSSSSSHVDTSMNIICPVCQDNLKQIKKNSRKLMSTICGHIFCDECVTQAVETQHKCPTCRRKLKKSQFHPIFL